MTITVCSRKFGEVENEISNVNGLVEKTDYKAKISDIAAKYFTTSDYNNFISEILKTKIKET